MSTFNETRFAVIADIHGNADALAAVLGDIAVQHIEDIVNLGDHLSGPMAARETADILLATSMVSIRGNHDRWLIEQARAEMSSVDGVTSDQLEERHMAWLQNLAPARHVTPDIFACHGTPSSDCAYWMETVLPEGALGLRPRDEIAREAEGVEVSLLLCGHSHLPRRVDLPDGRVILNPGSVGCPGYVDDLPVHHVVQTGTSADCYAVVEKRAQGWMTSFRHVPYDPSRMIDLAKRSNHPQWVSRVATGWIA